MENHSFGWCFDCYHFPTSFSETHNGSPSNDMLIDLEGTTVKLAQHQMYVNTESARGRSAKALHRCFAVFSRRTRGEPTQKTSYPDESTEEAGFLIQFSHAGHRKQGLRSVVYLTYLASRGK